ncbi:MAG: DUF308 domain-containing protein [Rikenellaceae bacterium]|nr:DUF308 domain-containing protein [Rikenellaceae bacterium]
MDKYMKTYNGLLWGVAAVIIGIVLVVWPRDILQWAVRLIGIVSIVIGAVQFFGFLVRTKGIENRWRYLPPAAPIAVIWGILLLLSPELWTSLFMILFGVLLIFLGLNQLVTMFKIKKSGVKVAGLYFFFPILLMIAGFVAFVQPIYTATWFMAFVGAWILAYGIMEIFGYYSLRGPVEGDSQQIEVKGDDKAGE